MLCSWPALRLLLRLLRSAADGAKHSAAAQDRNTQQEVTLLYRSEAADREPRAVCELNQDQNQDQDEQDHVDPLWTVSDGKLATRKTVQLRRLPPAVPHTSRAIERGPIRKVKWSGGWT
ncbi:hypothetical protein JOB18_049381 [Solea senegalensis]|uniref:Secreted protein n=1 Tax=Solea senegalensis TaxID=28829 RepID=A0AAV6PNG5_SOLSE|nr:hypothetical protein JOB18_049381 [Solea senegalensis]